MLVISNIIFSMSYNWRNLLAMVGSRFQQGLSVGPNDKACELKKNVKLF